MLAVQVVNYRTRRYLERCVETVVSDLDGSGLGYEINLLDNASGEDLDGSGSAVLRRAGRSARTPTWGSAAGTTSWRGETEAPYLLILNPDVEVIAPGTVGAAARRGRGDDRVTVAGPKLVRADGCAQPYDHGRLHGLRAAIALKGGHSYWRADRHAPGGGVGVGRGDAGRAGGVPGDRRVRREAVPLQGGRGPVPAPARGGRAGRATSPAW